ncbi:MAG TPA: hypothetical protein VEA37_00370, partial [Flavobacterium sp.]|nr:hypothetical protein [Flavobacterium sp.]
EVVEKDLDEIKVYKAGMLKELRKFENNRLVERYEYDDGQIITEDTFYYNEQGLLIAKESSKEVGSFTETLQYDDSGRIASIDKQYENFSETSVFDYSVAGVVSMTETTYAGNDVVVNMRISYINESGYTYKVEDETLPPLFIVHDLVYNGPNVVSSLSVVTHPQDLKPEITENEYTYDMITPVKGAYLAYTENMLGSRLNYNLYNRNIQLATENYLIKTVKGDIVLDDVYEFDEDGFPVKHKVYLNSQPNYEYVITYQ